ncbi:hypothetical protein CTI12_AA014370 [Artemisia annua]|uniref:Transmembrane protein n=1 Tax=Artemisia annua TaxID=35608 RepID=A0A2U1QLJ2_ARTAN|nr:hypothetical protein CTI12_AA014370 [Artemisia annua]
MGFSGGFWWMRLWQAVRMTEGLVMTFWKMLENLPLLYCDRIRVLSWGFVKVCGVTVAVLEVMGRRKVSEVVVRRRVAVRMTEGLVMTFWKMLENLPLLYCDRIRVLSWGFVKVCGVTVAVLVVMGRRKVSEVVVRRRVVSIEVK